MGRVSHLYGVFDRAHVGPVPMQAASSAQVLERVLIEKDRIDGLRAAIATPEPNRRPKHELERMLDESLEELDESYSYYLAKVKLERLSVGLSNGSS
jgi:hypothetical protein